LRGDSAARTDRVTGKPAHFLVAHRNGKPYTSNALRLILLSAGAEAQVQERVTPHRLRHYLSFLTMSPLATTV
jgi:site-specific recombinase XerD